MDDLGDYLIKYGVIFVIYGTIPILACGQPYILSFHVGPSKWLRVNRHGLYGIIFIRSYNGEGWCVKGQS
jgi:hypothetical protein